MKIYFAGSICGGREDKDIYFEIVNHLKEFGQVLNEHVGDKNLTESGEDNIPDEKIFERDISWVKETDVMVAEVSTPSLGVGYEIRNAEELGKRILCLFRLNKGKRLSHLVAGNKNLEIREYETLEEALKHIDEFLKK